ncbi:AraC family transcriptional regulator with amidase-like domain [Paraburkholderia sp. BL6669N2]|uniref:GlxA family transcriptional regulator n=1 Tax=unclassified Paraburkholderia TaxID=2615204 RepID=UPI000E25D516|nr:MULTISPECIES: helix-turn-helix domain-containing protein [unclassified Paraburkholderia]REE23705.1 AraC family transcriptional regulator with amidase-like domain [Paraburkholderia sp. BL27I4N3]REG50537.1 AraC family transcriptional regulator with amidase-like domain [Paraburkholderia sp. BL6669N2]
MEFLCNVKHKNALQAPALPQSTGAIHIGIALFNGFALPDVASIIEIFQSANALSDTGEPRRTRYEVSLLSASGGRIASSSSVFVWTDSVESRGHDDNFRALFIAGGTGATNAFRDDRLIVWLQQAFPRSGMVHAIAEGRLMLEAAGFSNAYGARIENDSYARSAFPSRPLVDSPSPLRTALRIVGDDLGPEVARQVADWVAPQGETQFSAILRSKTASHISDKIQASAQWLEANGARPISIDDAAQIAAMSERNFLRRFKSEMGVTPSEYLLYVRLDMSCRLLAKTSLPVDKIARRCGIGSGGRLAKLFRKHLLTTPTEYRISKQGSRSAS